jgi:small subunit ribosomal protein S14
MNVAKLCHIVKMKKIFKFSTRKRNRCPLCGRPRAYMRRFDMCRICFRSMANNGLIPGVTKASW